MAVKVQFEIGHTAKLRAKKTAEGFTHDWELYVRGVNKADISAFVEKVVFNLHDSFPKPKRTCKDAPYLIQESGYAGFLLPIDIHFRNRDDPKRFQFTYDLDLQPSGPPHHRSEVQTFIFEAPSDELRQKLLKGGGVPVAGVLSGSASLNAAGTSSGPGPEEGMVSKPKLSTSGESNSSKKHKSRTEDPKNSTFANVFGPPITKSKHSPEGKSSGGGSKSQAASHPGGAVGSGVAAAASSAAPSAPTKDKSSKDKGAAYAGGNAASTNSAAPEKSKERKEKYNKLSSPHKESRLDSRKSSTAGDGSKHEKRADEKSRKDKGRDKERERSREKMASSQAGAMKRPLSPKSSSKDSAASSPKRHASPASRGRADEPKVALAKVEGEAKPKESSSGSKLKDANGSSGGKKSKKEKKDKDKDKERDKEKRDENKERHRTGEAKVKEERFGSSTGSGHGTVSSTSSLAGPGAGDDTKDLKPQLAAAKQKSEKLESKSSEAAKAKPTDKQNAKDPGRGGVAGPSGGPTANTAAAATNGADKKPLTSNAPPPEKDKKSHKHKKKDKNKEKDRDKDKYKDKSKEKDKERDKLDGAVKPAEKPAAAETATAKKMPLTEATQKLDPVAGAAKKSQSKEKKSKESKSQKAEEKRPADLDSDLKASSNKHRPVPAAGAAASAPPKQGTISSASAASSTSSGSAANNNNIDLSDADSLHSMPEAKASVGGGASNLPPHSDSSNSSFPEILAGKSSKAANKDAKDNAKGETKQRPPAEKERDREKKARAPKAEREDKKRRRSSVNNNSAAAGSTFIEPPLKQVKRDPAKAGREKSKSPSLRTTNGRAASSEASASSAGFLPPPAANAASSSTTAALPASPANSLSSAPPPATLIHPQSPSPLANANEPVVNSGTTAAPGGGGTPAGAAACNANANAYLANDYLSELQELHHKIMTLQDNGELQHVVEMIAATGCYELTSKTFDFDLCKLDRSTVQRLQEYFSTSVS